MPKFRACTPSLTDPVVMVTGTEIADRPLRVRSGNSAGSQAGRIYFCFHSQGPTFNCVYIITSKIPVRWPGQCYGFTLSLIFKYCGAI